MRWAAIDFETATRDRASACSVGVVLFDDSAVVDSRDWLIRPPGNRYERWNIAVHGITPDRTESAPEFDDIWPEVEVLLEGRLLLAHNAAFDMGVIDGASRLSGVTVADHEYACTVQIARRAWAGIGSYRLPSVCEWLGIGFEHHHDALADAHACGAIAVAAAADHGYEFVAERTASYAALAERYSQRPHQIKARRAARIAAHAGGSRSYLPSYLEKTGKPPAASADADEHHPLCGRSIVFTGDYSHWTRTQAAEMAAACGAHCKSAVSRKTDYLVVGKQDPGFVKADGLSGKMRKALELVAQGVLIEILTEDEFAALL